MHSSEENLAERHILIQHTKVEAMIANGTSRPLEGKDYIKYCRVVKGGFNSTGKTTVGSELYAL
jgi:hypothetical protein